jgi:hypothetical protein
MVVDRSTYPSDFQLISQATLPFPATKVGWEPKSSVGIERGELLATSGDVLRIWELSEGYGLTTRSVLTNVGAVYPPSILSPPKLLVHSRNIDKSLTLWT